MESSKVVLIPCRNYGDDVPGKIRKGMELLGGWKQFVSPEEKILVKPNVLSGVSPEKAVTTHPAVFDAVLQLLTEEGYPSLSYGDGPGSTAKDIESSMEACGLKQSADARNVPMADFRTSVRVTFPEGKAAKEFVLAKAALDADAIISVCKMKTHALENITGAVKNQYGLVFGKHKAAGHALYPDSSRFAEMVVDLDLCVRPRLYIMDGVIAMEGNGPGSGDPVLVGVILLSKDPVAMDTVFARLVDLDPANVPTCVAGAKAGLGTMKEEEITVVTEQGFLTVKEAAGKFGKPDFNVKRKKPSFWRLGFFFRTHPKKKDRPVVDPEKCIGCGICEEACPVEGKAVHAGKGVKAVYDYKKCIRCYCCQEMCPQKAITKVE